MLWYENYGWSTNPFELKPMPDLVSGFDDIREEALEYIKSGDCCLLYGDDGMGKTTILKWLEKYALEEYVPIYINTSGMGQEEESRINIDKIIRDKLNFFNKIVKKEKKIVILLDDALSMPLVLGQALKRNFDNHVVKSIVMASPSDKIKNDGGIMERIGKRKIKMRPMTSDEAMEMIVKRVGYKNPFDHEGLELIFEESKFVPKNILETCELVAKNCIEKSITKSLVETYFNIEGLKAQKLKFFEELSPLQRDIVNLLLKGERRPRDLAKKLKKPNKTITSQLAYLGLKSGIETMKRKGIVNPVVEKIPGTSRYHYR